MSCEFISELRRLSKLSAEAVQNLDHFDPLKKYMHITRHTEIDFKQLLLKIAEVNHKQLVLVCGSAGDGKSHLLSYLKYSDQDQILDSYTIINDATESDAPNQTAIETLAERIAAFRDDRLNDGGREKVVLAINLGMLNNFIDSEQGKYFGKLKQYVLNNNIFSVAQPLPFNKDEVFHHIDFSNYQLYTLTADGARSDYLTELFEKVFGNNTCNPFYNTYINQGSTCPHHTQCPVRHNFELLMKEDVRKLLIQRIIEVCIKDKLVITSRDILNFIFDAVVSPDFDEKKLWNLLSNPAKFLETYISYTTPMLIFENRGTSSLIDCMTENAATSDNIEKRDCDVLDFYAADDITPIVLSELNGSEYSDILHSIGLSAIDNGRDPLKKYIYSPLSEIENKDVWEYLLKNDGQSAWGTDNRYLFSLYQGEEMGEEQSVVGEVNKDKIAITGNSRFGCWCCTMVKEDKSLKNFIDHGSTELIPLREYRNWLVELRRTPEARDYRRRNGAVYLMKNGEFGRGPFTLETRKEMLRRLLQLQKSSGFELISVEELKFIDKVWEQEGDLTCRAVVDIYFEVMGERLPWDQYKKAKYDHETLGTIHDLCEKHDVPFDLMSRLMSAVDNSKLYTRSSETAKEVEKVLNQGWLHFDRIREELENDITED